MLSVSCNANDGISLIQTAEGALDESTNILQRMRELSIQSSNGIYSDSDRSTLNAEVEQLKQELDRIAETTSFNGQNILDGSLGELNLQVGSEANQTIALDVQGFSSSSLGGASGDVVGAESTIGAFEALTGAGSAAISINDITLSTLAGAGTVNGIVDSINSDLAGKGVEASTLVTNEATSVGSGILVSGTDTLTIVTEDGDSNDQTFVITGTNSMSELIGKINSETSVTASLNEDNELVLSQDGIESITVTDSTAAAGAASGYAAGANAAEFALTLTDTSAEGNGIKIEGDDATANGLINTAGLNVQDDNGTTQGVAVSATDTAEGDLLINGVALGAVEGANAAARATAFINEVNKISDETGVVASAGSVTSGVALRSASGEQFSIEAGNQLTDAAVFAQFGLRVQNDASGAGSVASVDISTISGAQKAIDVIDTALEQINSQRADLGAINNPGFAGNVGSG